MSAPKWATAAGFLGTFTERVTTSISIHADGNNVLYNLISGSLPGGLRFSSTGTIYGTPYSVGEVITSKFVIRASSNDGVTDRTFSMDISGPTDPEWLTPAGLLPLGFNNQHYAINRQAVDYQLNAEYDKLPAGQQLRYFIEDGAGDLPPGLTLTETGRIVGQITDKLRLSYKAANKAGYDLESYDDFPYDHVLVVGSQIGNSSRYVSKIYQFYVTVTDGVASSKRLFRIKVEDPSSLRVDNTYIDVDSTNYSVDANYLLTPQWLSPANLGVVRANNKQIIKLNVYDFEPGAGPITYNVIAKDKWKYLIEYRIGDFVLYNNNTYVCKVSHIAEYIFDPTKWTLNELPPNFTLDSQQGIIYASLPYQPAYSRTYNFTVLVIKTDRQTGNQANTLKTFTLTVRGDVETIIQFITDTKVGSLIPGELSELFIQANHIGQDYKIKYRQIAGKLPSGLSLLPDGSISGKIDYGTQTYFDREIYGYKTFMLDGGTTTLDKKYNFTVQASDIFDQSSVEKDFYVIVDESDLVKYTNIYAQPMIPRAKRNAFRDFVSDQYTFPSNFMYRLDDPLFGIQEKIKLPIEYGIEQVKLSTYVDELRKYFYRKQFFFGEVKWSKAEDSQGNYVYDFVYIEIAEPQSTIGPIAIGEHIVYPNSISNMRASLERVKINGVSVKVDEHLRPRFMNTVQSDTGAPLGFILAVPLCYALPGKGDTIVKRIKLANFDFKEINFEIDRLVVDDTVGNVGAKYLLFPKQDIVGTNPGESLSYIVGVNETELDTEEGDPIFLE